MDVLALMTLLIYLSPNILFPEEARFLIHDGLNSNVVWYKNLAESGKLLSHSLENIPISIGGIPRGCYMSEFHLIVWIYKLLGPVLALNLTVVLIHIAAFISSRTLLKYYFVSDRNKILVPLYSLCYALLPFWTGAELSLAAMPLLLYAFLNFLYKRDRFRDWFILILFPFFSYLDFSNLFFSIGITITGVFVMIRNKQVNWKYFSALFLFALVSVIVEYRVLSMEFLYHLESNRANSFTSNLNFKGVIGTSFMHTVFGHYHAYSGQFPVILIIIIIGFIVGRYKDRIKISLLLFVIVSISVTYRLTNWKYYSDLTELMPFLAKFQLRFYVLFPLLWFIVFVITSEILLNTEKIVFKKVVLSAIAIQILLLLFGINSIDYYSNRFDENCFRYTYFNKNSKSHATFSEYFQTDFFRDLNFKQEKECYAVCIGIEPEILQYNGIKTIDGYFYYFPKKNLSRMCEINKYTGERCENQYGNRAMLKQDRDSLTSGDIEYYYNFQSLRKNIVTAIFSNVVLNSKRLIRIKSPVSKNMNVYRIAY